MAAVRSEHGETHAMEVPFDKFIQLCEDTASTRATVEVMKTRLWNGGSGDIQVIRSQQEKLSRDHSELASRVEPLV
jgi:hypothetical protein